VIRVEGTALGRESAEQALVRAAAQAREVVGASGRVTIAKHTYGQRKKKICSANWIVQ
jgi:hypothetical protein